MEREPKFIPEEYLEEEKLEQQPAETGEIKIEEEIEKVKQGKKYKEGLFLRRNLEKIAAILMPLGIAIGLTVAGWEYSESQNIAETFQKYQEQSTWIAAQREEAQKELKEKESKLKAEETESARREKLRQERILPYEYKPERLPALYDQASVLERVLGRKLYCPKEISDLLWVEGGPEEIDRKRAELIKKDEVSYEGWELCSRKDTEKRISNIIKYTLPKKWNSGSVSVIRFLLGEVKPSLQTIGYSGGSVTAADVRGGKGPEAGEINIYPPAIKADDADGTIIHEIAHLHDPAKMNEMPVGLEIELLSRVRERLHVDNRFSFARHEQVIERMIEKLLEQGKEPEAMKKLEEYVKMEEYWGNLFEAYYMNPDSPEIPNQDSELCEWYLAHIEGLAIPEDPQEWAKLREAIREKARGWAELREIIMADETNIVGEQKLADLSRLLEQGKIKSGQIANLCAEIQDGNIKDVLISSEAGKIIAIAK